MIGWVDKSKPSALRPAERLGTRNPHHISVIHAERLAVGPAQADQAAAFGVKKGFGVAAGVGVLADDFAAIVNGRGGARNKAWQQANVDDRIGRRTAGY